MADTETAAGDDGDVAALECEDGLRVAGVTICAKCVNLVIGVKGEHWWKWQCFASPRKARFNPVTGQTVADPPYHFCREMNPIGDCVMYSEGHNTLNPKLMPEQEKI